MNNINKQVTPDPHYSYEAFDLSARQVFNVNVGELIPVCCREVVPNDKFSVKVSDFVRALPMVTSPFVRAKQHLDFYFVPYTQLWSNWNQFITQRNQSFSSALNGTTFVPNFKLKDLYAKIKASERHSSTDVVGRAFDRGALRLLNMLGYSYEPLNNSTTPVTQYDTRCNPFRIAAYNKIWYDYYRNQQFDNGMHLLHSIDGGFGVPYDIFNYDYRQCSDVSSADLLLNDDAHAWNFVSSCQMRYRTWKKDLFTGLLPNTQYGAVSDIHASGFVVQNGVTAGSLARAFLGSGQDGASGSVMQFRDITNGNPIASVSASVNTTTDVFVLRKAYAVQKWRERALRAGNRVDNNVQAHYGSKPYYHNDWHPDYLGSVSGNLSIGDVDATAQTDAEENGQLGNVAGKAIMSFDGHAFNFTNAGDFGIIMGIYSILPESEYNAIGLDRENQLLEREDFFVEEYQNLGYEAVNNFTFADLYRNDYQPAPSQNPSVLGYAPRYWNYKTAIDKVYGSFMRVNYKTSGFRQLSIIGAFSHWVSPRSENMLYSSTNTDGSVSIPLQWFYVNPRIFDSIFNASVDPEASDAPDNYQFLVSLFMDCKAYRTMSVIGLPEL